MKKITLVLCALLLTAGVTKAGEYVAFQPSEPVAISWGGSGIQLDFGVVYKEDIFFHPLSENDVVKIHITNIADLYNVTINFKVDEGGAWAEVPNVDRNINEGVISFPIKGGTVQYGENKENSVTYSAAQMAGWIINRGLVITGDHYKVLDITVESENVADDGSCIKTFEESYNPNWDGTELISSGFKCTSGDYITATVALKDNNQNGQAQFQVPYGSWPTLSKGDVWINKNEEAEQTVEIEIEIKITDDELEAIKNHGLILKGQNTTVSNIVYHYTPAKAGYRPVYIPASRYATFCGASTCALPDGVNAYCVSSIAGNKAMTTQLSNIPASQGVILEGDEGIYQLYTTTNDAASVSEDNLLTGVVTRTQITDASNKYVLYNNSGTPEFRKINVGTYLDPFKAYLNAAGAEARIALSFDNETNGIDELKQQTAGSKQMFDLQGRRVENCARGLYIVNGKKVFVK